MIINSANLAAVAANYRKEFQNGFAMAKPQWQDIASLVTGNGKSFVYPFLDNFPALRKWLGDRVVKALKANSYTIVNDPFEASVEVPEQDIIADSFGVFNTSLQSMGQASAIHPDQLVMAIAAAGHSTLCYDGQYFLDTDHPMAGSTKSNYDATGGGALWILLDCSRPLKPLIFQKQRDYRFTYVTNPQSDSVYRTGKYSYGVDAMLGAGPGLWQLAYGSLNSLNSTNFDAAVTAMMTFTDDESKPLGVRPTHILCGPSNRAAARSLIKTQILANGASNPNFDEVQIIVSPYLT